MMEPRGRDERELGIDRAADRLAYLVLSYGLLAIVAYRSFVASEPSWDLLGLVVLAGVVGALYRVRQHVVSRTWLIPVGAAVGLAVVLGIVIAVAGRG